MMLILRRHSVGKTFKSPAANQWMHRYDEVRKFKKHLMYFFQDLGELAAGSTLPPSAGVQV